MDLLILSDLQNDGLEALLKWVRVIIPKLPFQHLMDLERGQSIVLSRKQTWQQKILIFHCQIWLLVGKYTWCVVVVQCSTMMCNVKHPFARCFRKRKQERTDVVCHLHLCLFLCAFVQEPSAWVLEHPLHCCDSLVYTETLEVLMSEREDKRERERTLQLEYDI